MRRLAASAGAAVAILAGASARAGTFDALGDYQIGPDAVASITFDKEPDRYLPSDADPKCMNPMYTVVQKPGAVEGSGYAELRITDGCAERFLFTLPSVQGSYRAGVWMRHGGLDASVVVSYAAGSGLDTLYVTMTPTGRTTSDGWVELASNEFPVDGSKLDRVYLKTVGYAAADAVEVDGFEVERTGPYWAQSDCSGLGDPVCGPEAVCIYNRCILGQVSLPVLPSDTLKNAVVDVLESQMRVFYGGRRSRAIYLPAAITKLEQLRKAKTAWQFWSGWAAAVHALHDWHTDTDMGITGSVGPRHRLNACFIEGDADVSHGAWASDPKYADILVSHVGAADNGGLKAGDRLIAVDGQHPIAWAATLAGVDWGYHVATDPDTYADFVEALGGPFWTGGALVMRYATTITVLRCDPNGTCAGTPETIAVSSLGNAGGGDDVVCDNRPFYHLDPANSPDPNNHRVFGHIYRGAIAGTAPEEAIFGMVWDTLNGGGNPNSPVNSAISAAITDWEANARGVILDHRAGNGGTLDAASNMTRLVRPKGVAGIMRAPIEVAGYDGPNDAAEGLAIYNGNRGLVYNMGADDWAMGLPVALIIHRDGSASDYMPFAMKGAPNTRLFGPHATAGAFSTFIEFSSWGGLYYQYGSGDTIGPDGSAQIGHGVVPDEIILPKQSDLLAGKDTLFEAALAWVRKELKP
jgi:hypothetical protein